MNTPEKPLTESEIDELYGLEPVLQVESTAMDRAGGEEFVTLQCPYCGEAIGTTVDVSAGANTYIEDCQVCCQPIEMELRVTGEGQFEELIARRGDS
jgi:hypothetical protein